MPITYTPIATVTASGSSGTQLVMSSIPNTYTDLILIVGGNGASSSTRNVGLIFNGDTATNYSRTRMIGTGTSVSTEYNSSQGFLATGDTNNERFTNVIHIFNYASSNMYKRVLSRSNSQSYISAYSGIWKSNSQINSISFIMSGQNIASGTTLTLFGIAAA